MQWGTTAEKKWARTGKMRHRNLKETSFFKILNRTFVSWIHCIMIFSLVNHKACQVQNSFNENFFITCLDLSSVQDQARSIIEVKKSFRYLKFFFYLKLQYELHSQIYQPENIDLSEQTKYTHPHLFKCTDDY